MPSPRQSSPAQYPKLVPPWAMYRLTDPVLLAYSRMSVRVLIMSSELVFAMASPQVVIHPVLQLQDWIQWNRTQDANSISLVLKI